ncbi:MurR/RpiR family transcriptional regulator [Rhodocista pekingensis]|uniref:MurR/RpiR family transcriptional regulator n=1 Tax=Rhodocista pekingensis TaxID=201185 RepID=A0ABW2KW81_9PROT
MLDRISSMRPGLRRSEQKIADIVLRQPHAVVNASVAELAHDADVSQPTVVRFCRSIGCSGYQDFKLRLAQDLAAGPARPEDEVRPGDPVAEIAAKVLNRSIGALTRLRNQLNPDALEAAVGVLAEARRLDCYGFGASGVVAQDAQNKFFRLGLPVVAYTDFHVQAMAAALLGPQGVALAVSRSGRTRELLRSVDLALAGGARVVAITASGSPLAERATVPLLVDATDDSSPYTPMTSRIAHLAVVDILQVAAALRRGVHTGDPLRRPAAALRDDRQLVSA